MIAHVLLNLLNELGKRDKMRGFVEFINRINTAFERFKVRKFFIFHHFTLLLAIEISCSVELSTKKYNLEAWSHILCIVRFCIHLSLKIARMKITTNLI